MKLRDHLPTDEASMDLTAMIDVVLLLIIFFVLGTEFAPMLRTPLDLPRERGASASHSQSLAVLLIDVTKDGTYRYAGQDTPLPKILQIVTAEVKRTAGRSGDRNPKTPEILVRADRACLAAHLNTLAVSLAAVGVHDWKLATSEVASQGGTGS